MQRVFSLTSQLRIQVLAGSRKKYRLLSKASTGNGRSISSHQSRDGYARKTIAVSLCIRNKKKYLLTHLITISLGENDR